MDELKEVISVHIGHIRNNSEFLITNIELASLAGIKRSTLFNVYNGTASIDSMLKVVKVLDVKLHKHIIKLIKETNKH